MRGEPTSRRGAWGSDDVHGDEPRAAPTCSPHGPDLRDLVRQRRATDSQFDEAYPLAVRAASASFWTPVAVATRAAELLARDGAGRIADIGSGAGKFCLVGAATTQATFVGVEQRSRLVDAARAAATRLEIARASFIHGTIEHLDPLAYDGFYLFNPFEENLWAPTEQLDSSVELSEARFVADIVLTERLLASARPGTRLVTYHGYGAAPPEEYRHVLRERHHTGYLDLWVKLDGLAPGAFSASVRPTEAS